MEQNKKLQLQDIHVHTSYSYCADSDMQPQIIIDKARDMELSKLVLMDHSAQLYVSNDDYWSGRFIDAPELIEKSREQGLDRMRNYRKDIKKFRTDNVRSGLEVEVDCNGGLTLAKEDREGWDLILGAVHFLPSKYKIGSLSGFMWANEGLIDKGIDVLAHPFRYFLRNKLLPPKDIYRDLAKLLARAKVAAEINFHTNEPDPEFFEICIEEGVKIAFGSDAHELYEVGDFKRNVELLESICGSGNIKDFLYTI